MYSVIISEKPPLATSPNQNEPHWLVTTRVMENCMQFCVFHWTSAFVISGAREPGWWWTLYVKMPLVNWANKSNLFLMRRRFACICALCVCRCEISKNLCCRNLAVEKAVSELPTECTFCLKQFPRSSLERHQTEECQDRYSPQKGPFLLPVCSMLNVPGAVMEFKEL